MSFLTLDSLAVSTPDGRPLFDNLTLAIGPERTGLVGRNGSGKSTLLDVIEGRIEPSRGSVHRSGSIARLEQSFDEALTVAETLGVADALARLDRIEGGNGSEQDFAEADWTLEPRLDKALADTGLTGIALTRAIATLSGGERTRIALARLLLAEPDVLLLDEPTNNLDTSGRAAIHALIKTWKGGLVIASHDRDLLEHVDRIVELSPVGCTIFGGGWSEFAEARDATRARAEAEAERAANTLKATERKAQVAREKQDRSDARGRAVRARGDQPKLLLDARQQRAEATAGRGSHLADRQRGDAEAALAQAKAQLDIVTPLHIDLPLSDLPALRTVLKVDQVSMSLGPRRLFGPLSFEIRGPERVAISGPNGSGKTTLLKLIMGELTPTSGNVETVTPKLALLDQHVGLLNRDLNILDSLREAAPGLNDHEARAHLARFAFRGDAALQQVSTLSGGERLRAGLAAAFAGDPPDLLLLDEPTNHLDLPSIDLLESALKTWTGALLVISHDEAFLEAIGTQRRITL
ncbi:MAG: ABC-F family ATP-binding cassette domain-containing protein [Henriciella sp.]